MAEQSSLRIKRVYDPPAPEDGKRILVDRLWPRGLKKEKARVDLWLKEAAPSDALRRWFGHDPKRWNEFQKRYAAELRGHSQLLDVILDAAKASSVTLLYSARDIRHNNAIVLKWYLEERGGRSEH